MLRFLSIIALCLRLQFGASFIVPSSHWNVPLYEPLRSSKEPSEADRISVAIVGSGAVGGYYGARLWESGYDVRFHMRGENYQQSTKNGFQVSSIHGDIFIPADKLQAFEQTEDIGPVDWVIVALKSTGLDAIPDLIFPLLKEDTRVLAIMNGLIEDDLIRALKVRAGEIDNVEDSDSDDDDNNTINCCAAVYGGMALVCSNRIKPGHVDHTYAGLLSGGVGAFCPERTTEEENQAAFNNLWAPTSIDTIYEPSLLRGRWVKNCWNLPFNGISVAMGGITVDKVVTDPGLRKLAYTVMDETIAVANTDLKKHNVDPSLFLGEAQKKQMMDLSDGMGPYRTSTMIDLTSRNSMEVKYLFRKPIERAKKLGVPVPHLETLVLQIEFFQRIYGLY
jgi:2-dehydropantoate 2-reductase